MRLAIVLLLALASGCVSVTPLSYAPDPAILRAIPPAKARETVKRQIERSRTTLHGEPGGLRGVEVNEEEIRFEVGTSYMSGREEWRPEVYEVARLDPHFYAIDAWYGVRLDGPKEGLDADATSYSLCGCLFFASRRDAELLIDALIALKGS